MYVVNLTDTSDEKCGCDSWIKHWERFTGREAVICLATGCKKRPDVGAHVKVSGYNDDTPYIVPLCADHNQEKGQFQLTDVATGVRLLAPANRRDFCAHGDQKPITRPHA